MEKQPITIRDIILIFIIISLGITLIVMTYQELKIQIEETTKTQIIVDPLSEYNNYFNKNDYGKINQVEQEEIVESICTDSDGGINYYEYGLIKNTDPIYDGYMDNCGGAKNISPSGFLNEAFCTEDGKSDHVKYKCSQGCCGTVCINVSDPYCIENEDGSITYNTQYGEKTQSDFCDQKKLMDYSCSGLIPTENLLLCTYGCKNNRCIYYER